VKIRGCGCHGEDGGERRKGKVRDTNMDLNCRTSSLSCFDEFYYEDYYE